MRINNNLMAMNTHRQLGINSANGAKSIEKLSSGYRINRAGDDAAGLAISEKMRAQIRGLNMASRNSQDGISLIQTAEGALSESHAILQRMRELAVQAANDTNVTVDREQIQKEMNQLTTEVNRIGNTTEFNTMKLLNGDRAIVTAESSVTTTNISLGSAQVTVNGPLTLHSASGDADLKNALVSGGINIDVAGEFFSGFSANASGVVTITVTTAGLTVTLDNNGTAVASFTSATDTVTLDTATSTYSYDNHGVSFSIAATAVASLSSGETLTIGAISSSGTISVLTDWDNNTGAVTITGGITIAATDDNKDVTNIVITRAATTVTIALQDTAANTIHSDVFTVDDTSSVTFDAHGISFTLDISGVATASANISLSDYVLNSSVTTTTTVTTSDNSLKFQVGSNQNQSMVLDVTDMRATGLEISATTGGSASVTVGTATVTAYYVSTENISDGTTSTLSQFSLDVSDNTKAAAAVTVINQAIENVSSERSKLGSIQNRLEHTIKNLDTSTENLQAAESRIRDVDMAKEMMEFTKNNILQQAAQAMLAQANQAPQGVLQLLR